MTQSHSGEPLAGPLAGLRVIEMGSLIAGPFCGQVLGDFGAEVIKLEDPKVGDPMRQWGRSKPKGLSPWWPVIGRNKKSVTIDLRTDEGRDIARALIAKADVVVENFRPGTLEKWGMGYEALAKTNPGLVMARVSGFGQTGPTPSGPATPWSARPWAAFATSPASQTAIRPGPASRSATACRASTPPSA